MRSFALGSLKRSLFVDGHGEKSPDLGRRPNLPTGRGGADRSIEHVEELRTQRAELKPSARSPVAGTVGSGEAVTRPVAVI